MFLVPLTGSALGDCKCERPQKGETTHWGGNMRVEIERKGDVKMLHGVVENHETPIQGALVEVFKNAEYSLRESSNGSRKAKLSRVTTCRTGADGKFCFRNLATGKYQIRSSIDSGWDVTFVNVIVDTRTGKDEQIDVPMEVGT
jgi:hypothetical protein